MHFSDAIYIVAKHDYNGISSEFVMLASLICPFNCCTGVENQLYSEKFQDLIQIKHLLLNASAIHAIYFLMVSCST